MNLQEDYVRQDLQRLLKESIAKGASFGRRIARVIKSFEKERTKC